MNDSTESLLISPEFYFQTTYEIPFQKDLESSLQKGKHPAISQPLPNLMFQPTGTKPFGTIRVAWNDAGLAISAEVAEPETEGSGKKSLRTLATNCAGLDFFIDTRDMKSNKRTNKFCHRFTLTLPYLKAKKATGFGIKQEDFSRQSSYYKTEPENYLVAGSIDKTASCASAWIPKEMLNGFDPENAPSLGFFFHLYDPLQGNQYFGIGSDFPYTTDPSLWSSLKMSR